ncbi:putative quinol monooxygenase [Nocardia sp. NPDC057440]|uniref:putative quinol monooxygenase n=1 Tax=Nocardia sp. NPDC057440 TaxID=3346134 RepID=UPI0036704A10
MSSHVLVVADVSSSPENAEELGRALRELAQACHTEPGCLSYDVFHSVEQPERYVSIEKYVDSAAFAAHRATDHFREIGLAEVMPLVTRRDVQMYGPASNIPAAQ